MLILLKENTLKTIWPKSLIRFHRVHSCKHFSFSDRISKNLFAVVVYGWMVALKGGLAVAMVVVA